LRTLRTAMRCLAICTGWFSLGSVINARPICFLTWFAPLNRVQLVPDALRPRIRVHKRAACMLRRGTSRSSVLLRISDFSDNLSHRCSVAMACQRCAPR
jgi:hypothetical protein